MSFSVASNSPPPAATLVSPSGTIGVSTPSYTWNHVNASTWFYLWVNNAAGTPVFQQWYIAAQICDSTACSVTPNVALPPGGYTWWIQTWNEHGYGPWSDPLNYSIP